MVKISLRFLTSVFLLLNICHNAAGQSPIFPHGFAPWELNKNFDFTGSRLISGYTNPPQSAVRASAEWEEIDALMVTWTDYVSTVREIVKYAREECKVYIVCSDSNSVIENLELNLIPLDNIYFLQEPYNSVWCRDYGPWNVYQNNADSLYLIDWIYNRPMRPQDNEIPAAIAEFTSLPIYQTILPPYDFVATGGNFMVDGWGTAFSSKLILDENDGTELSIEPKTEDEIDTIVKRFMGIKNYIKMETLPYDEIHHIDMHLKLLDEETLLVGEYPEGVADGPQIEENLNYILTNFNSVFGTPYKVVRIPMPPNNAGNYPDEGGAYRTYTNCVFINKTVLVPVYDEEFDTTGLRILKENLSGYKIIGINCNSIINALGAIHCITKEVASSKPLLITHQPLHDTENTVDDYTVNAWVVYNSNIGVNYSEIYYTTDTLIPWISAPMLLTDSATNTWTGYIPAQPEGTTVYYYIHALSNDWKQQVRPITAPEGFWKFRVGEPAVVITAENKEHGINIFPNPADNNVTINFSNPLQGKTEMSISNISGEIVVNNIITQTESVLSLQNLPSGTYFIKIMDESFASTFKIIKL
ncbi:MAG: agmatine deiminase family protein [Chitinophagales bacterium]